MSRSNKNDEFSETMGARLTEVRKILTTNTGVKWTETKLAKELGVTQNVISRLEKGNGAIDKLIKVLLFYHNQGFNIQWIILPDNSQVPMYRESADSAKSNVNELDPEAYQTFLKLGQIIFGK